MKVTTDDKKITEVREVRFTGSQVASSQSQDGDITKVNFGVSLGFTIQSGTGAPSTAQGTSNGLATGDMYWRLDGNTTATTTLYRLNTVTATTASWTALA